MLLLDVLLVLPLLDNLHASLYRREVLNLELRLSNRDTLLSCIEVIVGEVLLIMRLSA